MSRDFSPFFRATLDKPLHPLYQKLTPYLPESGLALELGCGVGHGVIHLSECGLGVWALDAAQEAVDVTRARTQGREGVEVHCADLATTELPTCQVVCSFFTLFFLAPSDFDRVWRRIVDALEPGGLFCGQLMGPKDDWAGELTTHTRDDVCQLLKGFEVIHLEEADQDGQTAMGESKHWHIFHVIARKRADCANRA